MSESTQLVCGIADCDRPHYGRKLCRRHWDRLKRYGDPLAGGPMRPGRKQYMPKISHRHPGAWDLFMGVVEHPVDHCVPWPFSRSASGYGRVGIPGERRTVQVHRHALELAVGPAPTLIHHAAHRPGCIGPECFNPHTCLRWATAAENAADRAIDGTETRGVDVWNAKLDPGAVREIRSSDESNAVIAARFGVSREVARDVRNRKTWKHVA